MLLEVKLPLPPDHVPAEVEEVAVVIFAIALLRQTAMSGPAFTVIKGAYVIVILLWTALQSKLFVLVRVSVTPDVFSAAVGV